MAIALSLFLLAAILVFLFEGVPLIKAKLWRELGTFGFLMGAALLLGIIRLLGISTPVEWLHKFLSPVGKTIFK